ncbi:branched-chain amino acid ABC transporter substrate-binding protein [Paraburkholderia sp. CNPSo 3076]|uniref:branched-chain amino acid ABC transporter substrate-binding protein n=1 Tax=Paraburkholderia sp. CNPSo 3076 TaxID=2940936 RepID=UPI00225938CA|nr:branched-chain amino acid ABC transporter substrate-binding protein [Paraburkholderia sp. CNPSo 3076]MCX5544222.1 branched-chain amino acid ABC transporter substrate-binding protein [Paraburkholderia sp. CNPSo 3076]
MVMEMRRSNTIIAVATIVACAAVTANADEVVKIGHVAPLTGGIAHLGKDTENGARLAIEEINASHLVVGGKNVVLQLEAEDDAGDPRTATQVAQKLVDDKVVAVIGHLTSGTTIPASKIYSDAGIVQISPSATNPTYTQQGFKTAYRMVATDAQQGPALATYALKNLHIKTIAIVDDATAYGQGLANQFADAARSQGIKLISRDASTDKTIDFRAILTKIKGEKPDAIMYGGQDATGGPFVRQAQQLGITVPVLAGDGVCTGKLVDLAGKGISQVICSEAGMALEKMPRGTAFEKKYTERFHVPIQTYSPFAYDAVYIIVDAMKRANSTDPQKISAEMQGTNYVGVLGRTQFDQHGDIKNPVISLYHYVDGNRTLLDSVRM